jgi:hypothetical protein
MGIKIMAQVLQIVYLLTVNILMVAKILTIIKEAADTLKTGTGEEKQAWVTGKLKAMFPKLNDDEIYLWIKGMLYLGRLVGIKM